MIWHKPRALLNARRKKKLAAALQKKAEITTRQYYPNSQYYSGHVLVISHDAYPAGAQRLLINLLSEWRRQKRFEVKIVCVESGSLRREFEDLYPTLVLSDFRSQSAHDQALVEFTAGLPLVIYSSTVVNGAILEDLCSLGCPIITHCHELQKSIERWAPGAIMTSTLTLSDFIIAGCPSVSHNLRLRHQVPNERLSTIYDFITFWDAARIPPDAELQILRDGLGLTPTDIVVVGCGSTDWRKGPDLFLEVAIQTCHQHPRLKFIWVGGEISPSAYQSTILAHGLGDRIRFIGDQPLSRRYYYIAHIYALTSREDPCPLAALEAANAQLPVVCFDLAGDIPNLLGPSSGAVVAYEDTNAFSAAVLKLGESDELRTQCGRNGYEKVKLNHSTEAAAAAIEDVISSVIKMPRKALGFLPDAPLVTVIVPNYNHDSFLEERLESVSAQSLSNIEIIVLDDASTDGSRLKLESFVARDLRAKLQCNTYNSGSTYLQWRKGLAAAQGKYIWIAESDDAAQKHLLKTLVNALEGDPSVVVAHAQSIMINENGRSLGRPSDWLDDLQEGRWSNSFTSSGIEEIRNYLSLKNTIPNASAVVFRNFQGIELLVDHTMRLCADWLFWIRLLARGRYAFIAKDLNYWRQNSSNARTRAPGVIEWEEGQKILSETAGLLNVDDLKRAEMIETFRLKCVKWSNGLVH